MGALRATVASILLLWFGIVVFGLLAGIEMSPSAFLFATAIVGSAVGMAYLVRQ